MKRLEDTPHKVDETLPKVLCVDDEKTILNVMERILHGHFQVLTATSGENGLATLRDHPDVVVILSDQKMDGISGSHFLAQSIAIVPDAIRIMVTAYSEVELMISAINEGQIYKFITKPFDGEYFKLTVRRAVEHYQSKKAAENTYRQLQEAQERLLKTEKMSALGKLMSGVAHELGSPIANIHNSVSLARFEWKDIREIFDAINSTEISHVELQMLLREKKLSSLVDDYEQIMQNIENASLFAIDLLRDLKGFSRDDEQWADVEIEKQIERAINLVKPQFKHLIQFHRDYRNKSSIRGLPGPLTQVMVNIIHNSAQSIQREGDIWISTWRDEERIKISIKDSGSGISPENLKKIFKAGFTTKPEDEGTGLGLAITHGIIEKHGGTIEVISALDRGSEFIVTLPIQKS